MTDGDLWSIDHEGPSTPGSRQANDVRTDDIAVWFARCLGTPAGQKVLGHLRSLTIERALGPSASNELLRHLEAQRHLVSYMCALVERGRAAPEPVTWPTGRTCEHEDLRDDR